MRLLTALAFCAVCCVGSSFAQADEFGSRFWAKAPAGLGDYTAPAIPLAVQNVAMDDQMAQELQDIAPAAGEETPVQTDQTEQSDQVPQK